ncbi:hypothetical protein N9O61_04035 [Octadecabacter sp.]|nr:hypothetical protein [Octadecabacter sp.]
MILEFALSITLTAPFPAAQITPVQFNEPIQQVLTYPPVGVVNVVSGLELPDDTLSAFESDFLDGSVYFGAFAITKDFGYGYVTGANSLQAAREIATAECLKHGPRCLIYAEILPENYVPLQSGQISMSAEAANYFNNPDPSWDQFRAMAVGEDGAYSVVWNYGSPREAADTALTDCNGYAIDDLPDLRDMPCVLVPFK